MEESVVPCYLDGYLWETYSVQFLSTLCAHKEGMAEEKKKQDFGTRQDWVREMREVR